MILTMYCLIITLTITFGKNKYENPVNAGFFVGIKKIPRNDAFGFCPISRNQPVNLSFMHLPACKKDFDICYNN